MKTEITHPELVAGLAKAGIEIVQQLRPDQAHVWHMANGAATEAGELLDAAKKFAIYQKPLDRENVIEELGDIEFYCEGIRAAIGVTREEVLQANIKKLQERYHAGKYSNQQAQERADKQ